MFEQRELDLFATNKPTLFAMSDQMPGSRVLDGRWGVEHIATCDSEGPRAPMEYLRDFDGRVQSNGFLAEAAERAGLRGRREAGITFQPGTIRNLLPQSSGNHALDRRFNPA